MQQNTSQKMFIGTDKISEILNDSDSDVGTCSELSDSDMCEVNSPINNSSSSEDEEVFQPEPDRGRKRNAGPFQNAQIQILSLDGKNRFKRFRNLHSPEYLG